MIHQSSGQFNKLYFGIKFAVSVLLSFKFTNAIAMPYGVDLHTLHMPGSGAVGGSHIARPLDLGSSVFGNPATLNQFGQRQMQLSSSWISAEHKVSTQSIFINGMMGNDSNNYDKTFAMQGPTMPSITYSMDLNKIIRIPLNVAFGSSPLTVINRDSTDGSSIMSANFGTMGYNTALSYQLNNDIAIGYTLTIARNKLLIATKDGNFKSRKQDMRSTLGFTATVGKVNLGGMWQSKLDYNYRQLISSMSLPKNVNGPSQDFQLSHPSNFGLGFSTNEYFSERFIFMADFLRKHWSHANGFKAILRDQNIYSFGFQYIHDEINKFRLGFSYANDPLLDAPYSFLGIEKYELDGIRDDMDSELSNFLQAYSTPMMHKKRLTFGFSRNEFFDKDLTLDLFGSFIFKNKHSWSAGSQAAISAWTFGAGVQWSL